MIVESWIHLLLVLVAMGGLAVALAATRTWRPVATLVVVGLGLRVLGSLARYEVLFGFYQGLGDAVRYFQEGNLIASRLASFDFSALAPAFTASDRLWGTPFVERVSGVVLLIIGPTMRGEFVVFGCLSFLGLLLITRAFQESPGAQQGRSFLLWLSLWPSLWFWPCSIGKEALLLLATGLVIYGYGGREKGMRWGYLLAGFFLCLAIRPHVAAVFAVCLAAAYWLSMGRRWTAWTILQACASAILAVWVLSQALTQLGLGQADLEGVQEFLQYRSSLTSVGGSSIDIAGQQGLWSIPLAFVNILMRPFLWEVHNLFALISALEIMVFWWLVWRRRRALGRSLRHWRSHRLLRFTLPAIALYVLMLGLTFGNLGIISRQRTLVFPLLFLVLEIGSLPVVTPHRRRRAPARPNPRRRAVARSTVRPAPGAAS